MTRYTTFTIPRLVVVNIKEASDSFSFEPENMFSVVSHIFLQVFAGLVDEAFSGVRVSSGSFFTKYFIFKNFYILQILKINCGQARIQAGAQWGRALQCRELCPSAKSCTWKYCPVIFPAVSKQH